jgi:hypothetical protein
VTTGGQPLEAKLEQKEPVILTLQKSLELKAGQSITVTMKW